MPRFFVKSEQIAQDTIYVIGEDVKHIKNVLRKQIGDNLEICNQETGNTYKCEIAKIGEDQIKTIIIVETETSDDRIKVDIYQGLPKADKMELIIQKCVELGVNEITPVEMKRCITKIEDKTKTKKIERTVKKIPDIIDSGSFDDIRNVIEMLIDKIVLDGENIEFYWRF